MRTGAIFARGSCRALKWMALFGVMFFLAGGDGLAQTATTHTTANSYSETIVVVEFSHNVWGNVPDGAFAVSTNSVVSVMGLPAASPGTRSFTIQFNNALAPGDNLVYTPPSTATLRLMRPDTPSDPDADPDEVATFTAAVTEENNPPVLPAIPDFAVMSGTTYTAASPAATLPKVTGASGRGTITYAIDTTAPLPAGLTVASTDPTNADFGKITGSPTVPNGTTAIVKWTATDSDTPPEEIEGDFRVVVQAVPGMPGALTATAGSGSVTLSWSAPTTGGTVTGYEYEQTVGGVSGGWMPTGTGTTTTLTLRGLTNGTAYAFRVRAVNTAGGGPASSIVTVTPVAAVVVPGMPGTLTATAGDAHVTLDWTAPTTGGAVTGYEYEQTVGGVSAGWMSTGTGTTTSHTVRSLTNGTTYAFRVRAVNTAGGGPASSIVTVTPVAAVVVPGMPGTLTAVAGNKTATLSWSAPTTGGMVASYEYQQTVGGTPGAWMPLTTLATATGTMWTYTVTGLMNGVTYSFQVRARNAAGPGDVSNIVTVTPAAGPARGIRSVSIGTIGEGGQAQATVSLTGPVPAGQFVRVKLRLVGKSHTRQNTPSGAVTGVLPSIPSRQSGGVRTDLSGELDTADYDANVAGELTIQAGQSSGQVTVYATTDDDAEDEVLLLQVIPDNRMFEPSSDHPSIARTLGGAEKLFWIDDSHTQGYALTAVPSKIYEAGNRATVSTVHFTPNFRRVDDLMTRVTLTSSHSSYSALFPNDSNTMLLPAGAAGVTAQFQLIPRRRPLAACTCDGDRMDDEVTVNAVIGGVVVASTTISVVDVHKLPEITVTAMTESGAGPLTELAEGTKYKVKVEANRNKPSGEITDETVTVTLPLADSSVAMAEDYRLTPSSVSISGDSNDQSKTFTLEVLGGDGDIGEEMLVLDAMVKGSKSVNGGGTEMKGMLSVTLVDTTTLNVEPKSDAEVKLAVTEARNEAEGADNLWTAGDDDVSIMLGNLFKLPSTGFNISADAMSADTEVVMAEADSTGVTVKAMGPGTTMVTVTATTAAKTASTQVSANIATVTFEIMVDKLDLVLMLSGPQDNMNLVEGDMPHANGTPASATLTVTANQKVADDIEVMIMRDRSKSTASEDDYEVGMLTIEAGEMSGTTMVMAVKDDIMENVDNMPEELVLYAMAGDMEVEGEVTLYLWDYPVPALPIIAQLLLAGILGIGGYRRYRRR